MGGRRKFLCGLCASLRALRFRIWIRRSKQHQLPALLYLGLRRSSLSPIIAPEPVFPPQARHQLGNPLLIALRQKCVILIAPPIVLRQPRKFFFQKRHKHCSRAWLQKQWISKDVFTTGFRRDRKSTRLNSSHDQISYAVFCLKKKKNEVASTRRATSPRLSLSHPTTQHATVTPHPPY